MLKSLNYAFATSTKAKLLGHGQTGCWYITQGTDYDPWATPEFPWIVWVGVDKQHAIAAYQYRTGERAPHCMTLRRLDSPWLRQFHNLPLTPEG